MVSSSCLLVSHDGGLQVPWNHKPNKPFFPWVVWWCILPQQWETNYTSVCQDDVERPLSLIHIQMNCQLGHLHKCPCQMAPRWHYISSKLYKGNQHRGRAYLKGTVPVIPITSQVNTLKFKVTSYFRNRIGNGSEVCLLEDMTSSWLWAEAQGQTFWCKITSFLFAELMPGGNSSHLLSFLIWRTETETTNSKSSCGDSVANCRSLHHHLARLSTH